MASSKKYINHSNTGFNKGFNLSCQCLLSHKTKSIHVTNFVKRLFYVLASRQHILFNFDFNFFHAMVHFYRVYTLNKSFHPPPSPWNSLMPLRLLLLWLGAREREQWCYRPVPLTLHHCHSPFLMLQNVDNLRYPWLETMLYFRAIINYWSCVGTIPIT